MIKLDLLPRWVRFALVGAIGFLIDAGMLAFLVHDQAWSPIRARALSFSLAVIATWALNRSITFPGNGLENRLRNFQMYFFISLIGFWINFGIYVCLLEISALVQIFPVVGVIPSAAVSAVLIYWGNVHFAFRNN